MSRLGNPAVAYVSLAGGRAPDSIIFSTAGAVLTDQAQAEQFFNNNANNFVWKRDLSGFEFVRLSARILVGSASANTPRLRLRYRTALSATASDYSDIGTSEVACSLVTGGATTYVDSGWVALATAAKADVYVALMQLGGNASADPSACNILAEFR